MDNAILLTVDLGFLLEAKYINALVEYIYRLKWNW